MEIIKPSIEFLWSSPDPLKSIERAGRTCYKSENKITKDSSEKFVKMLLKHKHEAMLEHGSVSYKVICNRGVTHEIVRHRLFSFAQESTRYVNYAKKGIKFTKPDFELDEVDMKFLENLENYYNMKIKQGLRPEQARYFLPNGLKAELIITGNFRQWRNFLKLRLAKDAHPEIREIANLLLQDLLKKIPIVFEDLK